MQAPLNVLIIGAGQIGASFDRPGSPEVLTHAHAFSQHSACRVLGFLDQSPERAKEAALCWGGQAYSSLENVWEQTLKPDICIIATPDKTHYPLLQELATYPLRALVVEKPISLTLDEAEEIVSLYSNREMLGVVNYSRRFLPALQDLRRDITSQSFGKFMGGHGYYGKGLIHNGSHLINLLQFLFDSRLDVIQVSGERLLDYTSEDASLSACLKIQEGLFYLQAVDSRVFSVFELDLLFEKKRIRLIDGANVLQYSEICNHPVYAGYRVPGQHQDIEVGLNKSLTHLVTHILDALTAETTTSCSSFKNARDTLAICQNIRNKSQQDSGQ